MLATLLNAGLALPCLLPAADDVAALRAAFEAAQRPEARIEVLDRLGEYYEPGEPDAVAVTEAVARALVNESYAVRAHAARLLGTQLDHDASVEALLASAATFWDDDAARREADAGRGRSLGRRGRLSEAQLEVQAAERAARNERNQEAQAWRAALLDALAARRDDRCVVGLVQLLPPIARQVTRSDDVVERLLALGTAPALEGALGVMASYEELLRLTEEELEHERTRPVQPKPSPRISDAQWAEQDAAMRANTIELIRARQAFLAEWGADYLARLDAFARKHALPDAPEELAAAEWTTWFAKHAPKLPRSLKKARKK